MKDIFDEIDDINFEEQTNLNKVVNFLKSKNINIDDSSLNEKEEAFTKLYYSTVLKLVDMSKKENIVLSSIHSELCNKKGIFFDTNDNRKILELKTGYSRSMINKALQALHKKNKLLNNQPAIIAVKTYSAKGKELSNSYMINPFLYSFSNWNETRKRRMIVTLIFSEETQDLKLSIKQEDEKTGQVILDSDCFDLEKIIESINKNNEF